MNLTTPKARAKHYLLFSKLASVVSIAKQEKKSSSLILHVK